MCRLGYMNDLNILVRLRSPLTRPCLHTSYKWTNATRRLRCSQHLIHKPTPPDTESILAQVGMQFHGPPTLQTLPIYNYVQENLFYPPPQKVQVFFSPLPIASKSYSTLRSYTGRPATRLEITVVNTCLPACEREHLLPSYDNKTTLKHTSRHFSIT